MVTCSPNPVSAFGKDAPGVAALKVNLLRCLRRANAHLGHHVDGCLGPDEGRTRSALLAKKDKPF